MITHHCHECGMSVGTEGCSDHPAALILSIKHGPAPKEVINVALAMGAVNASRAALRAAASTWLGEDVEKEIEDAQLALMRAAVLLGDKGGF